MNRDLSKDYFRLYGEIRRDSSNKIASDLRNKEIKMNYVRPDKRDLNICNKGIEWFNEGLSLDDAPEELKNNTNFINGSNKGKRLAIIESLRNDSKKSR